MNKHSACNIRFNDLRLVPSVRLLCPTYSQSLHTVVPMLQARYGYRGYHTLLQLQLRALIEARILMNAFGRVIPLRLNL